MKGGDKLTVDHQVQSNARESPGPSGGEMVGMIGSWRFRLVAKILRQATLFSWYCIPKDSKRNSYTYKFIQSIRLPIKTLYTLYYGHVLTVVFVFAFWISKQACRVAFFECHHMADRVSRVDSYRSWRKDVKNWVLKGAWMTCSPWHHGNCG